LYLPKEGTKDRARRNEAGVPKTVKFRTRHELALERGAEGGEYLPHGWIAGDDERGRSTCFCLDLRDLGQRDLLAVPANTRVRDRDAPSPESSSRG
jgi:hypothetical protein